MIIHLARVKEKELGVVWEPQTHCAPVVGDVFVWISHGSLLNQQLIS